MMLRNLSYILFPTLFASCQKQLAAPLPQVRWDLFHSADAAPLGSSIQQRMEGVYAVTEGSDLFGDQVVLKWSHLRGGQDSLHHVSFFTETNIGYITGEGRDLEGRILLETYWRTLVNTETGACWLQIEPNQGGELLASGNAEITENSIFIEGVYAKGSGRPDRRIAMRYLRPLHRDTSFSILAHRGGGRNSDQLPASENSIEMIRLAPRLGATGIEVDVKLTSDNIPILYHDVNLNPRLVQDVGLHGPIREYSHAQLDGLVRLVNGERIPTLAEALAVVIHETDLRYVWLDLKYEGSLEPVRAVQQEYMQIAAAAGRDVRILMGLPGQEQVDKFLQLPDHAQIPSLCELSLDVVRETNSQVWAPMWVTGQQDDAVLEVQAEGRKAFVWTMDVGGFIQQYMYGGHFDGILSNFPSLVAYYHHSRQ
jgi:glycerophosphoryl diester phosphodiesterase